MAEPAPAPASPDSSGRDLRKASLRKAGKLSGLTPAAAAEIQEEEQRRAGDEAKAAERRTRLADGLRTVDDSVGAGCELLTMFVERMEQEEQLSEPAAAAVIETARKAFDLASRGCADGVRALSDAEAASNRAQLKAQSGWYTIKLEHARTAGDMKLKNQSVELQAAHHKALEAKVAALSEGGDALLHEANQQVRRVCAHI